MVCKGVYCFPFVFTGLRATFFFSIPLVMAIRFDAARFLA
jgi:hypothetical protein